MSGCGFNLASWLLSSRSIYSGEKIVIDQFSLSLSLLKWLSQSAILEMYALVNQPLENSQRAQVFHSIAECGQFLFIVVVVINVSNTSAGLQFQSNSREPYSHGLLAFHPRSYSSVFLR